MRFFHLGDLHFGKMVHSVSMIEDQQYWLDRFLEKVDEYQPQLVLISGDVYDKRNPQREAIQLFDSMLTALSQRDIYTLIIAGNHDSWYRLAFGKDLLRHQKVIIAGEISKKLNCVTLEDEYGPIHFWLMPYLYPAIVADPKVLNNKEIITYDQAVRALISVQDINKEERNVILIHQNVLANGEKPEHSHSETIVGGLGEIDYRAFDDFDYVAMGHIHNAQRMGRDEIRYAGCPLYYDFSECNRDKSLTMVDMQEKNSEIIITRLPIHLLHKMKRITGNLEDVLAYGETMTDLKDYYIQAILEDIHLPAYTMDRLRAIYQDQILNVERRPNRSASNEEIERAAGAQTSKELPMNELFANYYLKQNGEVLDGGKEDIILKIMEQQADSGERYSFTYEGVSEKDTDDLIDYLMAMEDKDI